MHAIYVPTAEKPEVEYLLGLVKASACKFERNGKLYDGQKAYDRIKKKYEHFRDEITSTETFIEYAAAIRRSREGCSGFPPHDAGISL